MNKLEMIIVKSTLFIDIPFVLVLGKTIEKLGRMMLDATCYFVRKCFTFTATDDYSTQRLTFLLTGLSRVFVGLLDTIYALC